MDSLSLSLSLCLSLSLSHTHIHTYTHTHPLKFLCLLVIAFLYSDSSLVFTIVTKEQGKTDTFSKHGSHHSLANSCHIGTNNLSQVILICELPQMSHNVFPYWFTAKGANHSDTASFKFFCFFLPLFIVLNCCLSFALLYQTRVLYRKEMFYLIHFFQKIFHITYFDVMGANNGEQDVHIKYIVYILPDYSLILLLNCIKGLKGNKLSVSMLHRYTWREGGTRTSQTEQVTVLCSSCDLWILIA